MSQAVATLADVEAIESIPLKERNLAPNTYEVVQRTAEAHPDLPAIIFFLQATEENYKKNVIYNFKDLFGKITQTANMFHGLGVGPNDAVTYLLPNLPQTYFTQFGAGAAGIANPVNPLLEPHVWVEIMNAAQTKVLVTIAPLPTSDLWDKVASIAHQVPTLETILQVDISNYLGGIRKLLVKLLGLRAPKVQSSKIKVLDFDKTMAQYPANRLMSSRQIKPDDIAAYFHTGGTTGTPKLALHTHGNEVFDAWVAGYVIGGEAGKMAYLGLPLFHNFGAIAIGISAFMNGTGIVIGTPQGFRGEGVVENFWKILDYYKINLFGAVPTLYKALLNVPIGDADISHLELANSGAAPLPVELARQFTELTGVNILEGYGLTEATCACTLNPLEGTPKIGSVGYRFPYQEMKTAVLQNGEFVRFCEPDEVGTVIVRGPNVFPGYKDDFHNQGAFVETGDGKGKWLNTGDMGRQDPDGYFWLTGRKKELIIRGGHNMDPQLIEEPLHTHPAVALAAAVGRPDARVGEMPVAYVELKPGQTATEEELLEFAKQNIGERAAVPKRIYVLDEIPLTAVGKIFKPALTRSQVKDVYEAEVNQIEGVKSVEVIAEGDKRLGTIATVNVTPTEGVEIDKLRTEIGLRLNLVSTRWC
ncbi:MAG: acyl-CoA synthetase [Chloroflexota bacterium]